MPQVYLCPVGQTGGAVTIAVFLMTSNPPIAKAMPHRWAVYHQYLIRCVITECSCIPSGEDPSDLLLDMANELCLPVFYIVFLHLDGSA